MLGLGKILQDVDRKVTMAQFSIDALTMLSYWDAGFKVFNLDIPEIGSGLTGDTLVVVTERDLLPLEVILPSYCF